MYAFRMAALSIKSISSGTSWACSAAWAAIPAPVTARFRARAASVCRSSATTPQKDYLALTHDLEGRRINRADPDASLILLKATAQIAHGGQKRFAKGSWPYQLFREWIAQGAQWHKGSGDIASISISPPEYAF